MEASPGVTPAVAATSAPTPAPVSLRVQAFWLTAAKIVSILFQIGVPIILVRMLSKEDVGIYRLVVLYTGTVAALCAFGVGNSVFYFMPRNPERRGQVALNIVLYNLLTGSIPLLVLIVYPGVLTDVVRAPEALVPYAFPLGLYAVLMLSGTFLELLPTALEDVKNSTIMIVGVQFTKAIVFMVTVVFFPSVTSLLWAGIVHQVIQNVVLVHYMHKRFGRFWSNFEWGFFREHIAYAVSFGVVGLLVVVQRDLHNYFVGAAFSPAEFAIYSIGCVQVPLARVFVDSVATVVSVRTSKLQAEGADKEVLRLFARAVNRIASIQFPLAAVLMITGRDLIVLMYTKEFEQSADIFVVNVLLLIVAVFMVDPIFRSYKELRRFYMIGRVAVLVGLLATLYFFIKELGMVGAIGAAVVATAVDRLALTWKALHRLKASSKDLPLFADLFKICVLTLVTTIAAYGIRNLMSPDVPALRAAVTSGAFLAMYLPAMLAFKLPGSEELNKDRLLSLASGVRAKLRGGRG